VSHITTRLKNCPMICFVNSQLAKVDDPHEACLFVVAESYLLRLQ
jgi:hypothetical protein